MVRTLLSLPRAQVQSLPGELRSCKPQSMAKKNAIIFLKLLNDTNEFMYETETDPQTQKTNYGYQRGKAGEG